MYLNVNVVGGPSAVVSVVSVAELKAIQKDVRDKASYIVTEGDAQVARVTVEGNTQVAILEDQGEDIVGDALAEALNADQWANAPLNADIIQYSWNEATDTMDETTLVNSRSAYHWQEIAKTTSAGLIYQGVWDSVDCSLPPAPTPEIGQLADGFFYIVATVTGDTTLCPNLTVGDWLIWAGDQPGDGAVEGQWDYVNWEYSWESITGVTVNGLLPVDGQDLLPTTGGTMSGQIKGITPVDAADLTTKGYVDSENATQSSAIALKADITYVNVAIEALNPIGSVVLRMDAINPATIYGGTWALITGDASLSFGDGAAQDGIDDGINDPAVPLLEHTHGFNGDVVDDHTHVGTRLISFNTGGGNGSTSPITVPEDGESGSGETGGNDGSAYSITMTNGNDTTSSDGGFTIGGSNANSGETAPTLNVRGARISINVWQRTV